MIPEAVAPASPPEPDRDSAPLVSVVIPVFNGSAFVENAVTSALDQQYRPIEVIVVNDGSDDTPELERVLAPHRERISYISQVNQGAAAARNAGILAARGTLLAFLDADDRWYPEYLESQVACLRAQALDMIFSDARLHGDHPQSGMTYMETTPSVGTPSLTALLRHSCQPITSGTVVRRSTVVDAGLFQRDLRLGNEDFELWVRLAHRGARIGYQRKVLLEYHIRQNSLSRGDCDRAVSDVEVFSFLLRRLPFSAADASLIERQIRRAKSRIEVGIGKDRLAAGDFSGAAEHLAAAHVLVPSLKLGAIRMALRLSPALLRRVMLRLRPKVPD